MLLSGAWFEKAKLGGNGILLKTNYIEISGDSRAIVLSLRLDRGGGKVKNVRGKPQVRAQGSELCRDKCSSISSGESRRVSSGSAFARAALKASSRCILGSAVHLQWRNKK